MELAEFLAHPERYLAALKPRETLTLTTNQGREVVLLDAEEYERAMAELEEHEIVADLRESIASLEGGEGIPLEEVMAEASARRASRSAV